MPTLAVGMSWLSRVFDMPTASVGMAPVPKTFRYFAASGWAAGFLPRPKLA